MFYGALPPEVNTARLMAGAGIEPMYQAAAGWEALAISLETQAEELAASLAALQGSWQGSGSERAVQATTPMVAWLRTTALQAQKRAMQAIAQATAYTQAMVTTPPLPEIEMNHVTNATLNATNFLGVNTVPIGMNEFDYFVRMWNQAAGAMEGYQAETTLNTIFEPIPPMTPIVMPGVGESTAATAVAQNAAMLPGSMMRETAFAHVTADGQLQSVALKSGNLASQGNMAAQRGEGAAQKAETAGQEGSRQQDKGMQQGVQMATQMMSQGVSMIGQMPQQMMQPMQTLTQPLQQVTQIFSQMGSSFGSDKAQIGLIGASPVSNHPLAGGTGASSGAGLVRAASLPGMGGTSTRSPLMSSLVGPSTTPASGAPGAAAGAGGPGLAPVGGGGGGPMGAMGQHGKSGGSRPGLKAPSPLPLDEDDDDDW
ncbi:MAG: PPE family protein [Mycolicibacterium sp.]|nr:PPE family protein [Mycolicibacterium sp.]